MVHLNAFRVGIAACAVVSGLVLNGLTAWWLLRMVSRNAPPLYREYRLWAMGGSVLIVLLTAAAGGYLTYLGLRDPRRLPDALSVDRGHLHDPAALCGLARRPTPGGNRRHHPGRRACRKRKEPPSQRRLLGTLT